MKKATRILFGSITLFVAFGASAVVADPAVDALQAGFVSPPDSAKPQTWWHWMNGNISKPGITADLEAMKQIGLGGATIVNADCGIPRGPVNFMSPEWREDCKFAVSEANRLGLQICVENCAGWSSSGGPWNTPANGMQRLTASQTHAIGPVVFDAVLAQPPTNLKTYRDIAVLAFADTETEDAPATNTVATDSNLEIQQAVYEAPGSGSKDVKAKIISLIKSGEKSVIVSNKEMGGDPADGQVKRLRLVFKLDGKKETLTVDENEPLIFPLNSAALARARKTKKTSFDRTFVKPPHADGLDVGEVIPLDGVIDLTSMLGTDGHLKWNVPAGKWTIMRVGFTPIGVDNHPAPKEGLGLECDKLSKSALDAHWAAFMQKVLDDAGPLVGKTLNASLIDSYEVGNQDWTPEFREEFQKRRGYDPVKYLPTYARHIVGSPEMTERFLWDMRRTVADLFAENYYGHFSELCHQHGLGSDIEPYSGPYESLQSGASSDTVMGEFWTGTMGQSSVKLAASVAHIYGKSVVGAESYTAGGRESRWTNDPYSLKVLGDLMFCQGINRYIFHRYAMQPWTNRQPGMTMGEFGLNFERTETWWTQGKAWIDYISRCQYLLQQGRTIADVAYFNGENAPSEMRMGNPAMPEGFDYDAINEDVLLHNAKVENGRIVLSGGASYSVLVLPPDDINMTPVMLECISKLVHDGATVVGPRPQHSPSLGDYPECDQRVKELSDDLWGKCDGKTVLENGAGNGRIVWGKPLAEILASQKVLADFEFKGEAATTKLTYTHRSSADAEIYFVANQHQQYETADCTFRISGKTPEIWHPDTGAVEPAGVWNEHDGRTTVQLNFDPAGSVFVIFRHAATPHVVAASSSAIAVANQVRHTLEIQHAVYVSIDGGGEADVTGKISKLVENGQIHVDVTNDNLGDPAALHKKELRVDYTFDGKPGHIVVGENQKLNIPKEIYAGQGPQWEMAVGSDGQPSVRMWTNSRVEFHTASGGVLQASVDHLPMAQEIGGPWKLNFPPNWGAPASVTLDKLISWPDHPDQGVKYFSGTATYEKDFTVTADQLTPGRELWLDLGEVKNFAEVSVNDQSYGVLWKPPFKANITSAVKPGVNKLIVKVTNLWPNRIIGDEQLPPDCKWKGAELVEIPQWVLDGKPSPTGRFTFATWHHWDKSSPLLESGLIGPVMLRSADVVAAK